VNDPHLWWYLSRISAMIAWGLMSFSMVWGVLLASRVFRGLDNPGWLKDLHKYLSTLTILMAAVHTSALTLDPYVQFTPLDLLIPGLATYDGATPIIELSLAIGVIAFWAMSVVYVTSLIMDKLPRWLWKSIHYLAYVIFFAVGIHAAFSGTDVGTWWYAAVSITVITLGMIAVIIRLTVIALTGKRTERDAANKAAKIARDKEREETVLVTADEDSRERRAMVVHSAKVIATDVMAIRLIPVGGGRVAWWDAGSHITLHLPDGRERQYSLCGDPTDRSGYDIAVLDTHGNDAASSWIHANVTSGMVITVSGPRNHFPMVPSREYLFVAGGIGITPIRAMIESVPANRSWSLIYLGKNKEGMGFVSELARKYPKRVTIHESEVSGRLDLAPILKSTSADVFCCGPESLMNQVEETVAGPNAHVERFSPVAREIEGGAKPFVVRLASTGAKVPVAADQTVIDALADAGVRVESSCGRGVCGTCELRVVDGQPAHLDSVMSDAVKDEMHVFYPCVSRSHSAELTVDA
jgi:ferredoxin-NADP reductase